MRKNKPSRTAYKVAMSIVTLAAKPGMDVILPRCAAEATGKLLIASGVTLPRVVRWAGSQKMLSVYESFDWMLPGQFEAFAYRKAFCEHQVREGIKNGASQILVLGAGFDTLAWRLAADFSAVNFFEIDHPSTAVFKARGIEIMGLRDNLYLIAEDLGKQRLGDVLDTNASWKQDARTVFVAEGLVMYLSADSVRDLFFQCAANSGSGSRIAFSYIPGDGDGRPDIGRWTGLMLWLQKLIGEPWLWCIQPEKLDPFLQATGWKEDVELAAETNKRGVEFFVAATK